MENNKIVFFNECPENLRELIESYWELDEMMFFKKKPKMLLELLPDLTLARIIEYVGKYSKLTFYAYCENCNSYEYQEVFTQSSFVTKTKMHKSKKISFQCRHCELTDQLEEINENIRQAKILELKANQAIEEERWKLLNGFQYELLHQCVDKDFWKLKNSYWYKLGKGGYKKLFIEMEHLAKLDLIVIYRDSITDYITGYKCFDCVKENVQDLPFILKVDNSSSTNLKSKKHSIQVRIDDSLKFDENLLFSGVFELQERIILEPNLDYSIKSNRRDDEVLDVILEIKREIVAIVEDLERSYSPIKLEDGVKNFLKGIKKK